MEVASARPSPWPRVVVEVAALLAVVAAAPALGNAFVWDDEYLVPLNALLRDAAGLVELLTRPSMTSSGAFGDHYRPVLMLTVWLNHQLGGVDPLGYRVVNLVIHVAAGALGYLLLVRWLGPRLGAERARWTAAIAAALHMVHPLHAITFDLVLKRNSSLCALLMLAALLIAPGRRHAGWRQVVPRAVGSCALGALAVLTKEVALVLPALVLLQERVEGRGGARAVPHLVAPAAYALLFFPTGVVALEPLRVVAYVLAQPVALVRYAGMVVSPDWIAAAYDLEPSLRPFPWARLGLALGLLACAAWIAARRVRSPLLWTGLLWTVIWLATGSLLPIPLAMDEVRCYGAMLFPYAGLAHVGLRLHGAVARAPSWARPLRALLGAAAVAVALLLTWATARAHARWGSRVAVFAHALDRYPESRHAVHGLCAALVESGARSAAVPLCRTAVERIPRSAHARCSLAQAHVEAGEPEAAMAALRGGVRDLGENPAMWRCAGTIALAVGETERAREAFERLRGFEGADLRATAEVHLASLALAAGDRAAASAHLARVEPRRLVRPRERALFEDARRRLALP